MLLSSSVTATFSLSTMADTMPPPPHPTLCHNVDCIIPSAPPLPGGRQRCTALPRPQSPRSPHTPPPPAPASTVFLECIHDCCHRDGGGGAEWSVHSRNDDRIVAATHSHWNWSVIHAASWKRRSPLGRGDIVWPPLSNANTTPSSPRKAASYPTASISTAQGANTTKSA